MGLIVGNIVQNDYLGKGHWVRVRVGKVNISATKCACMSMSESGRKRVRKHPTLLKFVRARIDNISRERGLRLRVRAQCPTEVLGKYCFQ